MRTTVCLTHESVVSSSSALITGLCWVHSGSVVSCLDEWGLTRLTKLIQLTLWLTLESHELPSRSAPVCSWAQENKRKCARPSEAQTWNQFNFASPVLLVRTSDKASSDSRDGEKSPQRAMDFFSQSTCQTEALWPVVLFLLQSNVYVSLAIDKIRN